MAGWLLLFAFIISFVSVSPGGADVTSQLFSPYYLLFYFVYIFLFYFNAYFLIPRFYLQKKFLYYFIAIVLLLTGVYFLKPFDHLLAHTSPPPTDNMHAPAKPNPAHPGRRNPQTDIISLILFVMVWSISTATIIIRQWRDAQKKAVQAEADKANAELSFLKAQIHPHFLFNTLNNIYSLAVTKNENTAISIMRLSNIMRYVTDDANNDYVSLDSEVECVNDYINLQRIRLSKKVYIDFSVSGDMEGKNIAPLILMTFIENVFKYGISNHEPSTITIKLFAEDEKITFFCQNRIFSAHNSIERTGIGISNTKKRLQHLYPGKHSLDISAKNGFHTVQLTLQI